MLTATGYTLLVRVLGDRYSPLFLTATQSWVGALFFIPFVAGELSGLSFNGPAVLAIVYLGSAVSGGAYLCYNWAITRIGASLTAAYVNLIPVFTLALAMIFLGDQLLMLQWFGVAFILLGTVMSQLKAKVSATELLAEAER
jgi:drug/metabolite transporter (DMT)-like permease